VAGGRKITDKYFALITIRKKKKAEEIWKTHQIIIEYRCLKNVNRENILWHVVPLPGKDRVIKNIQQPLLSNGFANKHVSPSMIELLQ
jgi:hypothetical protein